MSQTENFKTNLMFLYLFDKFLTDDFLKLTKLKLRIQDTKIQVNFLIKKINDENYILEVRL